MIYLRIGFRAESHVCASHAKRLLQTIRLVAWPEKKERKGRKAMQAAKKLLTSMEEKGPQKNLSPEKKRAVSEDQWHGHKT